MRGETYQKAGEEGEEDSILDPLLVRREMLAALQCDKKWVAVVDLLSYILGLGFVRRWALEVPAETRFRLRRGPLGVARRVVW